jgi:L-fuconolactonase
MQPMPDFPIVDAHVHLYDPGAIRYAWMREKPVLDSPHGLAELDQARGPVAVQGLVWIEVDAEPGQHRSEARWVAGLAAREPRITGIVAHAPLENGAAAQADIEHLLEHRRLKGIRRLLQDESDDAFCLRPGFAEGVRLLARHDLSFDICVYHRQLGSALELARRCPEVRFVLDHMGKPGVRDCLMEPWRTHIEALAALPNVWCKISGLITEAGPRWTLDQLRPYLDHAIGSFGLARLMFGSDWPVSEQTHRYQDWVEVVDQVLGGASEDERRQLFCDNAIAFYRLDAS